ncbi:MAG: phosphoribosyltransferase [Candidatus Dormibacteraeota bacterium]|nr:phosphoribosyltransferase [Candidatus Dormibacteraeota bacterium]
MFRDRLDAAEHLAVRLAPYRDAETTVVLGIPRGGVVVAAEIASRLHLPLGIAPVRKVGAPGNPELAVGAVDNESGQVLDPALAHALGLPEKQLVRAAEVARQQLRAWLDGVPGALDWPATGRTVILVDDGVATGYTARVAVEALRRHRVGRVILAVPVAPADTAAWLRPCVDEWVCLKAPERFYAVGNFFADWPQVTDDQVRALLLVGNRM